MSEVVKSGALTITRAAPCLDFDGAYFLLTPPVFPSVEVKEMAQGSWDKDRGRWKLPPYRIYAHTVLEMYPGLHVTERAEQELFRTWDDEGSVQLPEEAYGFQAQAMRYLAFTPKPGALLALSPGLGKTMVALWTAKMILGLENVLIVAPLSLVPVWQDEAEKWLKMKLASTYGLDAQAGWQVTNYNTVVGKRHRSYCQQEWDLVIIDESILIKNRDTVRFKKLSEVRRSARRWWELSGSPTSQHPDDLWTQLNLIDPFSFRSYWRFTNRYCWIEQGTWGTQNLGARQDRDVNKDCADLLFVRNQEDVLPDLPEVIPMLVPVTLSPAQQKAYKEMNDSFLTELETDDGETETVRANIVLSQLIRLQQITSNLINVDGTDDSAKDEAIVEVLESGQGPLPALIWTQWVPGAEALKRKLEKRLPELKIGLVHGGLKTNDGTFAAFKSGGLDILICSLAVGKFGHTMTHVRSVHYKDKSWFADDFVQSIHRVKRIGLKHRPLIFTYMCRGTVDQMVEDNLAGKLVGITKISRSNLANMLRVLRGQ